MLYWLSSLMLYKLERWSGFLLRPPTPAVYHKGPFAFLSDFPSLKQKVALDLYPLPVLLRGCWHLAEESLFLISEVTLSLQPYPRSRYRWDWRLSGEVLSDTSHIITLIYWLIIYKRVYMERRWLEYWMDWETENHSQIIEDWMNGKDSIETRQ